MVTNVRCVDDICVTRLVVFNLFFGRDVSQSYCGAPVVLSGLGRDGTIRVDQQRGRALLRAPV